MSGPELLAYFWAQAWGAIVAGVGAHPLKFAGVALAIVTASRGSHHIAEARGWRACAWMLVAAIAFGFVAAIARAETLPTTLGLSPR